MTRPGVSSRIAIKPPIPSSRPFASKNSSEYQVQAGDAAAGDPVLLAIDDKAVAAPVGACRHLARRAAGARLGDADRRLVAGQDQLGGEPLLRLAAVFHDCADRAHIGLDGDAAGDAATFGHLFDHQYGIEITRALPAVGGRNGHAEIAGLFQQADIVPRVLLSAVDLGGTLGDRAGCQLARLSLKRALCWSEGELHDASRCFHAQYESGAAREARHAEERCWSVMHGAMP